MPWTKLKVAGRGEPSGATSCIATAIPKRSRSYALSGWVDWETGRWRLRGSRESRFMEDAGHIVGASRHHPVPVASPADKARKATSFSAF
ncbi:hypothetical protein GCM10007874_65570 [Labrys miyagiensis]|uniref:Uncharacterized protein n=1 Tax=Labrys miyagiensis TaxID=346912 RepID=A0ABQ6CT83_9HYPH|nr:hypothetical protein GCM10007874_65570 [Labrys miyagiensis]